MRKLTIYRLLFTGSDCYKAGTRQTLTGVQVHSTGANNPWLHRYVGPDDGRLGPNKYGNHSNQPGGQVCASAYIGKLQDGTVAVYQTLPWEVRCWLSGGGSNGNANRLGYAGFEVCEDSLEDETYFRDAVMDKAVLLTAHLLTLAGRASAWEEVKSYPQGHALAVMDHRELHDLGLASNHKDIRHWLQKWGLTMQDFREAVDEALREGVEAEYIETQEETPMEHKTLSRGSTGQEVTYLQTLLCDTGAQLTADGIFGAKTEQAVKDFQWAQGLKVDGIVGKATWNALETATAHDSEAETGQGPSEPENPSDGKELLREALTALKTAEKRIEEYLEG